MTDPSTLAFGPTPMGVHATADVDTKTARTHAKKTREKRRAFILLPPKKICDWHCLAQKNPPPRRRKKRSVVETLLLYVLAVNCASRFEGCAHFCFFLFKTPWKKRGKGKRNWRWKLKKSFRWFVPSREQKCTKRRACSKILMKKRKNTVYKTLAMGFAS